MRLREILTWNPLSTPDVKEIVKHATKFELVQMLVLGTLAGLLFGGTMALFMRQVLSFAEDENWVPVVTLMCFGALIITAEVLAVRFLSRHHLCRMAWAKAHGFDRSTLKLTRWP